MAREYGEAATSFESFILQTYLYRRNPTHSPPLTSFTTKKSQTRHPKIHQQSQPPFLTMALLASLAVSFVALLHIYILVLEMFLWATPRGLKAFGLPKDLAIKTKALAANQGLYNGFLAVGLGWGLQHPVPEFRKQIQVFFLAFVALAGVFGAATAKAKILFVQTVPAALAIAAVLFA